jgi:AraC family transcriptional regulator, regulatory protein of adaptative response / DNA-3-methyladenine glycosylase II
MQNTHLVRSGRDQHIIEAVLLRDFFLHHLIVRYPGLRMPGCWDKFELLLRVIIGQQISVAGATTTMRRLANRIGVTLEKIASSSIEAIGMPQKAVMPGQRQTERELIARASE